MALPATHVRYALERMPASVGLEKAAYLAGTLYPDSRMLTGVSREQTHADACLEGGFATSPFRLGWQLHCHCDHAQAEVHTRIWPAAARLPEPRRWIAMSAAKMVQDEADRTACPLRQYLEPLTTVDTPFGEDVDAIDRFYRLIHDVYAADLTSSEERFVRLWAGVGLEPALIDRLMGAYADLTANPAAAQRIAGSMAAMLDYRVPPAPQFA